MVKQAINKLLKLDVIGFLTTSYSLPLVGVRVNFLMVIGALVLAFRTNFMDVRSRLSGIYALLLRTPLASIVQGGNI